MRTDELAIESYKPGPLPTLRDIVTIFFRQRWAMAIVFVIVIIAAVASGKWVPKYEAQMKIMVRRQRSDAIVSPSASTPDSGGDQVSEEYLNSEVELLNSEDLLRKVVVTTGLSAGSSPNGDHDAQVKIARAVANLSKELDVRPLRKTNVIVLTYQNRNPEMAAEVLKALGAAYVDKHLEVHRSTGELNFFEQQANQYQQSLTRAQEDLINFTQVTGVVSADAERQSALQQANEFDATAKQAQTTVAEIKDRIQVLTNQLRSTPNRIPTVARTSGNVILLQQLDSTILDLQLKKTALLTRYQPSNRLVQEVDQQISDAQNAEREARDNPIRDESTDLNPNYQTVQAALNQAEADLSGMQARAADAASNGKQYRKNAEKLEAQGVVQQDLIRNAKTQESNYILYTQKQEEARISDALDQRGILNVAVAEQPVVPALPNGSPLSAALVIFLMAGTLSVSSAFVCDFMDPSFRTPDEVTSYLGTPVLAALPRGDA